jgi:hypothetical protein
MATALETATPPDEEVRVFAEASLKQTWREIVRNHPPRFESGSKQAEPFPGVGGSGQTALTETIASFAAAYRGTQTGFSQVWRSLQMLSETLAGSLQSGTVVRALSPEWISAVRSISRSLRALDLTASRTASVEETEAAQREFELLSDVVLRFEPKKRGTIRATLRCIGRGKLTSIVGD